MAINKIMNDFETAVSGVKDGTLAKVSGYFENVLLNEISGVDTGLIHAVSGWNENYTHQVSGWADYNLNAVSGLDGVTDNISGYFADELLAVSGLNGLIDSVSGWTDYNLDVIYEDLVEISGVGGLIILELVERPLPIWTIPNWLSSSIMVCRGSVSERSWD